MTRDAYEEKLLKRYGAPCKVETETRTVTCSCGCEYKLTMRVGTPERDWESMTWRIAETPCRAHTHNSRGGSDRP